MPIEQEQYYQRLWETNRETVQQHFWKNLAYTQSFSTREEVEKAARDCEISLPSALCPVLLLLLARQPPLVLHRGRYNRRPCFCSYPC